jgi:hypothetical protein
MKFNVFIFLVNKFYERRTITVLALGKKEVLEDCSIYRNDKRCHIYPGKAQQEQGEGEKDQDVDHLCSSWVFPPK